MLCNTAKLFKKKHTFVAFENSLPFLYSTSVKKEVSHSENLRQKIIFNSLLIQNQKYFLTYGKRKWLASQALKNQYTQCDVDPPYHSSIALKYLEDSPKASELKTDEETPGSVKFPYKNTHVDAKITHQSIEKETTEDEPQWVHSPKTLLRKMVEEKHWLPHDPDFMNDAVKLDTQSVNIKYGTSDPEIPVSDVPCGGCGALLHCQDTSIPGFLPKEIFDGLNKFELKTQICQRCHFLKDYDIALGIDVSPDDYPKILAPLKNTKALVLLMVDLLDVPCSIWPGIIDLIGRKRPIVVIGNKIDMLMQDGPNFFNNVKSSIMDSMLEAGVPENNIKHIALISAKTGFGVESLITTLHLSWRYQGDIYIVGCTNVGKSTLFNTFIQSDLCKVQAVDLMQRATVSAWPGTTLNLLKFPILRPSQWRLHIRKERMIKEEKKELEQFALRSEVLKKSHFKKQSSLSGSVGRSFVPESALYLSSDPFSVAISTNPRGVSPLGLNPENKAFVDSKWCYDTPGVVHPDQALNLLTTPEIMLTIPKKLINPRPFHLRPGHSILIGGLARVDFVDGPEFVWFTVFAADTLPITITKTEDVEEVYNELLGTELLQVPKGGSERLKKWPGLSDKTIEVCGKYANEVASDLVLSSAGWIAVTMQPAEFSVLRAWTPEGRGIHLRLPFVKKAHKFKGSKIAGTPAFRSVLNVNS